MQIPAGFFFARAFSSQGAAVMRVLKFGGTSVADAAAIDRLVAIVRGRQGARTVVVSALGGVTDRLLAIGALAASDGEGARAALTDVVARHEQVASSLR